MVVKVKSLLVGLLYDDVVNLLLLLELVST